MPSTDLKVITNEFETVLNKLAGEENVSFDPKLNPHFIPFYIFSKLWNKYSKPSLITGKRASMKFVMMPFCQHYFSEKPPRWGWLVLVRNGERSSKLEFHIAGEPYQSDESNDFPALSIWAGFWKGDYLVNDENANPRVEFHMNKQSVTIRSDKDMERVDVVRGAMDEIMYFWKPILQHET